MRPGLRSVDPIVSYPASPTDLPSGMRARCPKYLPGTKVAPWKGVLGGIPLPQAGPVAGSRSLRERLVPSLRAALAQRFSSGAPRPFDADARVAQARRSHRTVARRLGGAAKRGGVLPDPPRVGSRVWRSLSREVAADPERLLRCAGRAGVCRNQETRLGPGGRLGHFVVADPERLLRRAGRAGVARNQKTSRSPRRHSSASIRRRLPPLSAASVSW